MSLFNSVYLIEIICLLLLISLAQPIPIPQYDNVDYTEVTDYDDVDEDFDDDKRDAHAQPSEHENKPSVFKLPENYSTHKSPPLINGGPIPVEFSMLIFNVFDIKEIQEEISMEVNYKLQWKDTRLSNWTTNIDPGHQFTVLSPTLLHRIWHPDIFIDHIKRVTQPNLISTASSLRIYHDGSLRYSSRMLIVLTCRMDFHYYPADTQSCTVTVKSFAFSTKHIMLSWRDGIGALMAKSMDVHNFDVALETYPDFTQETKSNNYTALSFGVRLRRKLSYHIIQTYVPSTLFTIVSWLSFLVPPDSTPGRMAICVTTLLTVTAMFGSVKQNTPNVSYIKALDIWMFMCIVFIFMSLAEFTVILKLRSKKEKPIKPKIKKNKSKTGPLSSLFKNSNNSNNVTVALDLEELQLQNVIPPPPPVATPPPAVTQPQPPPPPPPAPPKDDKKPTRYFVMAARIEKYVPRIVPFIFVCFTCSYWPYLLIASDYYKLKTDPDMYYNV